MINWEETLASSTIMDRGRSCFLEGGIVGLKHTSENVWEAMAVGSDLYRVSARIADGLIRDLSCSCPYATKYGMKQTCKHEVALFYALEAMAPGVFRDDDRLLSEKLDKMPADVTESALQLAISTRSTRCVAVLLNHRGNEDGVRFSPDEFSLDDLPAEAIRHFADKQGDNGPLRLLFGKDRAAMDAFAKKYLT